ncbi:MAG TPA: tetratricopeptide repeat protein [Longimicrobiales bacterium]
MIRRPWFDRRVVPALGIAIVAVAVYANSLGNGFAYDDVSIVVNNDRVHSLDRMPEALSTPYWPGEIGRELGAWRPLTIASFALDWALWQGDPLGFHAVNVALHAIASVLVLLILLELLPPIGAAAGALVFAVHPVHVEAVANVVGRAELLAAVFVLSACLLHLEGRPHGSWRIGIMAGLYAAAALAKETGIVLPALLLLLDFARGAVGRAGGWGAYMRHHAALFAVLGTVALGVLAARLPVLGSVAATHPPLGAAELQSLGRFWTVVSVWPHYLRLIVWPLDLSADYTPEVIPISSGPTPLFLLGLLTAGLAAAGTLAAWRGRPLSTSEASVRAVATGILFFCIAILPVANIFFLSGILLAERTLYLPSVGVVVAIGWLAAYAIRNAPRIAPAALAVLVALLGLRTLERNPTWLSTETVFKTLLEDHPESGRVQWMLGHAYFRDGMPDEGVRAYARAIASIGPHYPLFLDLARDLIAAGRSAEAESYLWRAHRLRPDLVGASHRLMNLLVRQGRYAEAERVARAALESDSTDAVTYHALALIYTEEGRIAEAIDARRKTIAAGEGARWQQWYWLAELLIRAGRDDEAISALDSARVRTGDADALEAIRRLRRQAAGEDVVVQ